MRLRAKLIGMNFSQDGLRQLPGTSLIGLVLALGVGMVAAQGGAMAQAAPDPKASGASGTSNICFGVEQLAGTPAEKKSRKGIRTFDRPPTGALAPFSPIPAGLRGAIRRVHVEDGRKLIALTFDLCEQRGEVAGYDSPIFEYLRANAIKATLFASGKWMRSHAERTAQLMVDPLFEIGNHGEAHRNLRGLEGEALDAEITGPQRSYEAARAGLASLQCVKDNAGVMARVPQRVGLFRFPFGACNARSMSAVNDAGLLAVQWDVSTGDPDPNVSAAAIAAQMVKRAKPGSIILAHANGRGHNTAAALPMAIPKLKAAGFEFVTVSELLAAGRPEIVETCYDRKPGDSDRYDVFFTQTARKPR